MKDLYMTTDGDILIDPETGDLMTSDSSTCLEQRILFHLKTLAGDYLLVPRIGASLERFIGEDNTQETGDAIKSAIEDSFATDNSLMDVDITVDVAPVNKNELAILVTVPPEPGRDPVTIVAGLSLNEGFISPR